MAKGIVPLLSHCHYSCFCRWHGHFGVLQSAQRQALWWWVS